jgi:hypothetical protein
MPDDEPAVLEGDKQKHEFHCERTIPNFQIEMQFNGDKDT